VPDVNPLPVAVSVKPGPPARAELGEIFVSVNPLVIVNPSVEVDWPADVTPTCAIPGFAISDAGTVAVSWVALPKEVASTLPFQVTTAPLVNPVPFAVKVNCGPPDTAVFGEMLVSVSVGAVIVNGSVDVVCPLELTETCAVPAVATRVAGTVAVS